MVSLGNLNVKIMKVKLSSRDEEIYEELWAEMFKQ